MGDSIFFKAVKKYISDYEFANVDIFDLKKSFETVSGEDLYWFFNQWFLSKELPELVVNYTYNENEKKLEVKIVQEKNTDFDKLFVLPVDILIGSGNEVIAKKETITHKTSLFQYTVKEKPSFVCIDKYTLPLSKTNYTDTNNIAEITTCKKLTDLTRLNALNYLNNDSIKALVFRNLLIENNTNITLKVLGLLKNFKIQDSIFQTDFKPLLIKFLNESENVEILVSTYSVLSDYQFVQSIENISNSFIDSSYNVKFSYLEYFLKTDLSKGLKKCEEIEQSKDENVKLILGLLYSIYGNEKNETFYKVTLTTINHKKFSEMLGYYFDFVVNRSDSVALNSIDFISELNENSNSTYIKEKLKLFVHNLSVNYSKKAEFNPLIEAIIKKIKEFSEL
ncbi:MAG: hypothetical protein A2046_05835 [Bacteroidetes bacterium GWA2_30_7]|nr:MAG: hypothetical protein A2046_05835 [Bacteroidetes bacterium GWA2_30_7]